MDKMLKLYKIVDGTEVAFPNDSEQLLLSSFDYSSQRMGNAPIITGTIMHGKCLDDYFNEIKPQEVFIVFNEERYYLKNTPTSSFSNTDARYKHDVEFVSERIKLSNVYFYDVVSSDVENDKPVSNSSVVTFSGNIREFAARLNYSLQYAKLQTISDGVISGYNVVVDDDVSADEYKLVSFSNQYFEAVLQQTFELYGVPYYFKGKTIHFGWTDANSVINETLKYGKDNSLLSITKSNANNQIINRCTGTGSADNISFYYPNNSELGELEYTLKDNKGNVLNDDFFVKNYNVLAKSVEVGTTYQYYDTTNYIDMEVLGAYFCKKEGDSPTTDWERISYGDDHVAFNTYINIKTYGGVVVPTFHHYRIDFKIKAEATVNLTFKAGVTTPTQDGSQFFFDLSDARFVRLFKGEYSPTNYAIRTLKTSGDNISFHLEEPDVYSLEVFDIDVTKIYPTLNNASYALEFFNVKNISAEDRTQEWRNEKGHTFRNLKKVGLTGDETKVPFGSTLSTKVLFRVAPQPNLMPYIYRESRGNERFYNAENNKYLDENNEYYEFANTYIESSPKEHIQQFEDIKPSIEGVVNNAGLPINVFTEFAYDENDNDEMDGENFKHPYFYGKLRKMDGEFGLNIFDYASEEGEMTISMIDGSCSACQFKIGVDSSTNKNHVQVDENGNLKRDSKGNVLRGTPQDVQNDTKNNEVWVALMKDKDTFNTLMPNATLKPSVGDKFVILHIELPREYVWAAEQKLTDAIIKHMAENNDEKFKFSIKFSRIYLAENPDVLKRLSENSTIRFEYNGVEYFYYVSSFSYRFKSDEALPEINVELSDTIDVNVQSFRDAIKTVRDEIVNAEDRQNQIVNVTLNKYIRNDVDSTSKASIDFENGIAIANNSVKSVIKTSTLTRATDDAIYSAAAVDERINEKLDNIDSDKFLRKDVEDIAEKRIAFKEGLVVSDFSEGVLGTGGAFIVDEHGSTHIVGDYLDIRKKATFTTISVQELKHVGGEIILSPAAMVCSKVEETVTGWKCYFNTTDGERRIYNEFEVGDFARCQTFNLEKSKYYWRKVEEKGTDYIVLSKSYCDPLVVNDVPEVGDNISQCGNESDTNRQSAIILSAYGVDTPSYKQYNGIDRMELSRDMLVTKLSPKGNLIKGDFVSESTGKSINDDIENIKVDWNKVLQQTDKEFTMWFFGYVPTMDNIPAAEWTTDELKLLHEQDLFFNTSADLAMGGRAYRFELKDGVWGWYDVTDADTIKALENAFHAQQSADSKMRNFVTQPVPPYDKGDRWCNATYDELYDNDDLVCITPKAEGEVFDIGDWQPTSMAKSATIKSFVKFTFDENGNKVFESGILLEADEINFKGKVLIDGNFSVDEDGNITLNNLTANDGVFNGEVNATNGIFNDVEIKSGEIGGFTIEDSRLWTTQGKGKIIIELGTNKGVFINESAEAPLFVARNDSGTIMRLYSQGNDAKALELVCNSQGNGTALQSVGNSQLVGRYKGVSTPHELVNIAGLALSTRSGLNFHATSNDEIYSWTDFLVADGDIELPDAKECKGKILFVKANGGVACSLDKGGIVRANSTTTTGQIDSSVRPMIFISNGEHWYEFYCG